MKTTPRMAQNPRPAATERATKMTPIAPIPLKEFTGSQILLREKKA